MTNEVIVITSGKGGVGKTLSTANIGAGLAKLGQKVVLVDMDIGLRKLDLFVGFENQIVYNVIDVIEDNCSLEQALIYDEKNPNLCLLASAQTREKSSVTPEQMVRLTNKLRKRFNYILIDCPTGIEQGFRNAISAADRAIVVITPENASIRDADRIIGLLEANDIKIVDLIINRICMDMIKKGYMTSIEDIEELLPVQIIGMLLEQDDMMIAANTGIPLTGDESFSGQAYMNISKRIMGEDVSFLNLKEPFTKTKKTLFHRKNK